MSQKPTSGAKKPLIRSYGRRRTKGLRPIRTNAINNVLPSVNIVLPDDSVSVDPQSLFDLSVKNVWFEIGFGNGEHLLHQAIRHPEIGFIGCEPFINGVSALCVGIRENNVSNIRIWPEDARILMERFKPQTLDRLFLLHPDPWPKSRHHKRRFVQTETLDEMARLLKPGAELRMATDHRDLAIWLLDKTCFHSAFKWLATSADDWRHPPDDWPETRYGQKGVKAGRPPVYFSFQRI
ncbi:MAG: tRNA (guanosine(46)-N7)-methyltransferase TrmB [Proteobacteria bacterium]|nr:tRNA (guanosine(46)-N7)-methyltransferase TrmB [Pseudomonadota bacterium]